MSDEGGERNRSGRPTVSVIVPFAGSRAEGEGMLAALARLRLAAGDELIVVDNTPEGALANADPGPARVLAASAQRSSYYARNCGAERSTGGWLLFLDSDCVPPHDLIERYFSEPLPERCGVVAGGVRAADGQPSLVARYARSRGHIDPGFHRDRRPYPAGVTANLLVRREAWESLGGFQEGIRSGGDLDLCWRIQSAGWGLAWRGEAEVEHEHVETLAALVAKTRRHAAGRIWLSRRWSGSFERPRLLRPLARCALGVVLFALTLRFERALFKGLDAVWIAADQRGWLLGDNRAEPGPGAETPVPAGGRRLLLMTDAFPARSETFIYREARALRALGLELRVESSARPARVEREVYREMKIDYLGDSPPPEKLAALVWLISRHPLRVLADRRLRRRLASEEPEVWPLAAIAPAARRLAAGGERHIHVHFAAGAAGHALRLARLCGVTYSVAGHGYDLFREPRNLELKLDSAAVVIAPCEYTAAEMRALAPRAPDPHVVVMGVDGAEFARRADTPDAGVVVAVGRLVPKKGFADLIEAAALASSGPWRRLVLVGDGPLRESLLARAAELGLGDRFTLVDGWGAGPVRSVLEGADLLAMPAVIAADGDRDAMPVVVKEAMAMELPVVASDEVGLPELVHAEWGALVPPGDPPALAAAIETLLELPAAERRAMGARGRAHVLEHCDVGMEARRLERLLVPLIDR